jgi:hypothetical protein
VRFFQGLTVGFSACLLFAALLLIGPALAAHQTLLNYNFAFNEIQTLDTAELARQLAPDNLPGNLRAYSPVINSTIRDLRPWIDSQTRLAVGSTYDFLSGNSPELDFTIKAEIVRQTLVKNFETAFKAAPPAGYSGLAIAQQQQLLNQYEQQLGDLLPQDLNVEINSKTLGSDATQFLDQTKTAYGLGQKGFVALLIVAIILLIAVLVIQRQLMPISRTLGIVFLLTGGLGYGALVLTRNLALNEQMNQDWPAAIQAWLPGLIHDAFAPWGTYALALCISGAALLIASFFLRTDH